MNTWRKLVDSLLDLVVPENKKLGRLLSVGENGLRSLLPRAERQTQEGIFASFDYRNRDVRSLVWAIKYKNNKKLLEFAGRILYEDILAFAEDKMLFENKTKIILVPIPMDHKSERKRGWNQSLELCRAVAKLDPIISVLEILEKTKSTSHQQILSRKERLQNIKNSMQIKSKEGNMERWKDSLFVIVDDVTTTGATITEARRALSELGLEEVLAVTLAH